MTQLAPIVLFTYKRLDTLKLTVEALQRNYLAGRSELIIFSDAAKCERDVKTVIKIRDYLKTIHGFKSVSIYEAIENKGLAKSIIEGVTQIIDKYGRVIVLEDDLVTSPNFLDFMNQAIEFYADDSETISISGYSLDLPSLPGKNDIYFGYRASSWGWATWKDRWEMIDWGMKSYDEFMANKQLKKNFLRGGSDLIRMLKNQKQGKIDSWAIRFCFHQSLHNLKTVFPTISKVQSIGYSKEATHTVGTKRFITKLDTGIQREFSFTHSAKMAKILEKEFRNKFSIKARALDKLKSLLN